MWKYSRFTNVSNLSFRQNKHLWKHRGTLTATTASRRTDENSFLMGRLFLWKTTVKGDSLKALAQLLENPVRGLLITNAFCSSTPEKNEGPSRYKHSELSPFICHFPSYTGENSFLRKTRGVCSIVFQVPWGREGASRSEMQKWDASCCSSLPYVYLRSAWLYDVPCFSCLGEYSMYEKSIKKQTSYRAKLKPVDRRETAGSSSQAVLVC